MTWIAEHHVVIVGPDGERQRGWFAITKPERDGQAFRCIVYADQIVEETAISGATPLQALILASQFLAAELHDFTERGGRFLDEDGTGAQLDFLFGGLWRARDVRP